MSLKLPRLNVAVSDPKTGKALREFSRFWDTFASAIETNFNAIVATVASIEAILNGTTQFTSLNVNGTSYSTLPALDAANEWTMGQTFDAAPTAPAYEVDGTQVVGAQQTGWTAGTGTANKAAYATYAGHTAGAAYAQAEAQATDDAAKANSQRIKAIEDALRTHGLIN